MSTGESKPQATTIPLIQDCELRLAKMRRQLEDIYRNVDLAHEEVIVAADAAREQGMPHLDTVLRLSVSNRLFGQLKGLTNIIERLGGKTDLSEDDKTTEAGGA